MWKQAWIAALAFCLPAAFAADEWPTKPVRFIVPSLRWSIQRRFRTSDRRAAFEMWRQPVVVENRPGGGTSVGTNALAKAMPDGYTIGWVISAHAINPSLYTDLPYDTLRDFSGVTLVYALKPAIVTAPSFPANSVAELLELARRNPGKLTFASPATGSSVHLVGELFKMKHGLDVAHVGYKGGTAAHPDVMTERVSFMFDALPNVLAHVKSGKLKLIAVVSERTVTRSPGVSAFCKACCRRMQPSAGTASWFPPDAARDRREAQYGYRRRDSFAGSAGALRELRRGNNTSVRPAFDAFIQEDVARWADVVKRAGIRLEAGQ